MSYKPIHTKDIAKLVGMSTSAMRHYESWGIIPPVPRSSSGYRLYSEEHVTYIKAIRAMASGFGLRITGDTMRDLQRGDVSKALWRVNDVCVELQKEKAIVERTLEALHDIETAFPRRGNGKADNQKCLTIKNVAQTAGVSVSAIRYWESCGIITLFRNKENAYRTFTPENVREVLIIQTMRTANYSITAICSVLEQIRGGDFKNAIETARMSLSLVNQKIADQMRGIRYLHELLVVLGHSEP